jgi:hypothetical protein
VVRCHTHERGDDWWWRRRTWLRGRLRFRRRSYCAVQWDLQLELWPDEVEIDQDVSVRSSRAAIEPEDLEPALRVTEEPRTDAVECVAGLDGIPPGAVGRFLDATGWIRDTQGPADEDQSAPIENTSVALPPALVGLKDELGPFCGSP